MRIIKKINNNVGLGIDQHGNEVFVVGKGIGFQPTPYVLKDDSPVIERIFVASDTVKNMDLFNEIPKSIFDISNDLFIKGEQILVTKLNPNLVFSLADHIHNALERGDAYSVPNPLQYDIRLMYPKEYELGMMALDDIEQRCQVRLEDSEAAFMALHFVNAQFDSHDGNQAHQITGIIKDIVNIVKYEMKIDIQVDTINFSRFATHIRYFAIRQLNKATLANQNESFYQLMKQEHPKAHECVSKIENYLYTNYGWKTSNDEKLYLMLHIQRLTR